MPVTSVTFSHMVWAPSSPPFFQPYMALILGIWMGASTWVSRLMETSLTFPASLSTEHSIMVSVL